MKVIVVGLGVQGQKRKRVAGSDFVAAVDPVQPDAQYRDMRDVPLADYDAALVCTPDEPKIDLLTYLTENGKHALVEKPLWAANNSELIKLQSLAKKNGVYLYTAYNHRYEPHFIRMRDLIASGTLGRVYRCRMFYGNGTARLVRDSVWRDQGTGVLADLGSHLLDTISYFFGEQRNDFSLIAADRFENRAFDHVVFGTSSAPIRIELEMSLLMWRNHFTCDVFAENGTAHIESLCKWGPSRFTVRTRVLPSGRPPEESTTLVQDDPTWAAEYADFKSNCLQHKPTDFGNDIWLNNTLHSLGKQATKIAL